MSLLFDIGYNAGGFSKQWLDDNPTGKVIGVDANDFFGKRVHPPQVTFVNCLMSDKDDEEKPFFIDHMNRGVATASEHWATKSRFALGNKYIPEGSVNWSPPIKVPTRTLDSLTKEYGFPSRIKIDVEGYEAFVLAGLTLHCGLVSFEWTEESWDVLETSVLCLINAGYTKFGVAGFFEEGDIFEGLTYDAAGDTYGLEPKVYMHWGDLEPLLKEAVKPMRRINYGMFFAK